MEINKFAKRALLLAATLTPVFWLTFSDEGKRFTDVAFLEITGREGMAINFSELRPDLREQQLQQVWPDLELDCKDQATPFGTRLCAADIAAFNRIPARYVTFFFAEERLRAVKIGYQRLYHEAAVQQLGELLGAPDAPSVPGGAGVYRWPAGVGTMAMAQRLEAETEPALMWLAGRP